MAGGHGNHRDEKMRLQKKGISLPNPQTKVKAPKQPKQTGKRSK